MADEIEQLAEHQRAMDERAPRTERETQRRCEDRLGHKWTSERCANCGAHRDPSRAT